MPRVLYEGKERPKPGFQVLDTTPYSHSANLAPAGPGHPRTYLTYRRAAEGAGLHALGITDLCLVLPSKGEGTPHTYCRLPRNLNPGMVSGARAQGCNLPRLSVGVWTLGAEGMLRLRPLMARVGPGWTLVLGDRGLVGILKTRDHLGVVEEVDPRNLCSRVSACLLLFLGQWGPAVYLCYKVGLAKANTLVYEAGELPCSPSLTPWPSMSLWPGASWLSLSLCLELPFAIWPFPGIALVPSPGA